MNCFVWYLAFVVLVLGSVRQAEGGPLEWMDVIALTPMVSSQQGLIEKKMSLRESEATEAIPCLALAIRDCFVVPLKLAVYEVNC